MSPKLRMLLLSAIVLAGGHPAVAQTWPNRPVRVIVSQAAGGTPDIICRMITDRLARALGQQMVVENRPGAGNIVGAQAAARAASDGYTFFFATAAALVTNPYTFKSLPYDPARDFIPVAKIARGPFFVLTHPSVPAQTLTDLIALEKSQPGRLTFATDGHRNFSGMIAAWLNKLAGTRILQVPYTAMPQGIQDALANRVQLIILAIPSAAPLIQRGDLRALAVTSAQRAPGYDSVPPVAETFPGFDFIGWFAMVAPAGTPAEIVQRMNKEIGLILADPEIAKRLRDIGFYTDGAEPPERAGEFFRSQLESWGRVVHEIGLQPE
jgi:tripartite-type tricarboxylate transporter receptor subunit TctC